MVITGKTTIENWLDSDTINYIEACVLLADSINKKESEE